MKKKSKQIIKTKKINSKKIKKVKNQKKYKKYFDQNKYDDVIC